MSTRDEAIAAVVAKLGGEAMIDPIPAGMAVDALIAEGWRKKPSREELREAIGWVRRRIWLEPEDIDEMVADVLALMDRGQ